MLITCRFLFVFLLLIISSSYITQHAFAQNVRNSTQNNQNIRTPLEDGASDGYNSINEITIKSEKIIAPSDMPYVVPSASSYISNDDIERKRGTSPGDFFKGVLGVLNSDNRNSGALDLNIRGMQGQGRVSIIIDGSLQEDTIDRGYSGIAGRTYLDPDIISNINIEAGQSTGSDATGAIGGIVRAKTIGVEDILMPNQTIGILIKSGFNSNSSPVPKFFTKGGIYGNAGLYLNSHIPEKYLLQTYAYPIVHCKLVICN